MSGGAQRPELERSALADELTGLRNRRQEEALRTWLAPVEEVAMIDVDHFKQVNDGRGHAARSRTGSASDRSLAGPAGRDATLRRALATSPS